MGEDLPFLTGNTKKGYSPPTLRKGRELLNFAASESNQKCRNEKEKKASWRLVAGGTWSRARAPGLVGCYPVTWTEGEQYLQ